MGFRELILLGCECNYGIAEQEDTDRAYFYDFQDHASGPFHDADGERTWQQRIMASYRIAARSLADMGVRVWNATPGGLLESFPRMAFEEALR